MIRRKKTKRSKNSEKYIEILKRKRHRKKT